MPELRRDPVVGYWTIIATERGWRPVEFMPKKAADDRPCPFCEGRESETTEEIDAFRRPGSSANGPGWDARVILSKMPILAMGESAVESFAEGMYDLRDGVGRHEVVVESPHHRQDLDELEPAHVEKVIRLYLRRFQALEADERFNYALLFKNHGLVSGSAKDVIRHARSQIIGLPIIPKRVKEELHMTRMHFERRDRCVICDILRQEKADGSRRVAENASFFCFCPFAARSPFEMWILPKKHSPDFGHMDDTLVPDLAAILKESLSRLRVLLADPPFNYVMHTAPFRRSKKGIYWKTIESDYHWHLQISPRLTQSAGFEWGSGIHINPTPPEEAAQLLREVF